jgi:uncharacterized alkaline shock family protein YloU
LLYHYADIVPVGNRRELNSAHWPKAAPKLDNTIIVSSMQAERSFPGTPTDPDPSAPDTAVPGRVEITPAAIATLASRAIGESYGVVGLASRHSRPALAELLRKEESHKGVEVSLVSDRVVVDLYVILEYGTRIITVAENLMTNVKFAVEQALGDTPVEVNVNVQGIRVSNQE